MTHETVGRGGYEANDHCSRSTIEKGGFEQSRLEGSGIRQMESICSRDNVEWRDLFLENGVERDSGRERCVTSLESCKFLFCF